MDRPVKPGDDNFSFLGADVGQVYRTRPTALTADEDGVFIGMVQGDRMGLWYLEPGETFRIADCHMMERQ